MVSKIGIAETSPTLLRARMGLHRNSKLALHLINLPRGHTSLRPVWVVCPAQKGRPIVDDRPQGALSYRSIRIVPVRLRYDIRPRSDVTIPIIGCSKGSTTYRSSLIRLPRLKRSLIRLRTPTIDTSEPTQPALLKETVLLGTLASGTVILFSPVPTGQIALTAHKVQISDKIFQFVFHKRAGSSKAQATSSVLSKASDLVKGQHKGIPKLVSILGANHLFIRELTSFANELEKPAGFDMLLGKEPSNDLRLGMNKLNRNLDISEPIGDLVDSLHEQVLVHNAAWLIITQYGPLLGGNTRLQSYRLLNAPSVGR
jgi:hypothetical protein